MYAFHLEDGWRLVAGSRILRCTAYLLASAYQLPTGVSPQGHCNLQNRIFEYSHSEHDSPLFGSQTGLQTRPPTWWWGRTASEVPSAKISLVTKRSTGPNMRRYTRSTIVSIAVHSDFSQHVPNLPNTGICAERGVLDIPLPRHLIENPSMVFSMGPTGVFGYTGLTQADQNKLLYWSVYETALPDRDAKLDRNRIRD